MDVRKIEVIRSYKFVVELTEEEILTIEQTKYRIDGEEVPLIADIVDLLVERTK